VSVADPSGAAAVDLDGVLANARAALLAELGDGDHWRGELSSSALSTATAIVAMRAAADDALAQRAARTDAPRRVGASVRPDDAAMIAAGVGWLIAHQNADGGWGDTVKSFSNISTTTLCWAAMGYCGDGADARAAAQRAQMWLSAEIVRAGAGRRKGRAPARPATSDGEPSFVAPGAAPSATLDIPALVAAIEARYGVDRTFAVPILTLCAIAGVLGDDPWRWVRPLPFELAALPRWCFRIVNLQVVSYALPALIAVGQARCQQRPSGNPVARVARAATRRRTLRLLGSMQPSSGGYLEAIPLTSFVAMSLCAAGERDHGVTARCLGFLRRAMRADGSWAIDSDLATWCTTLAVNALAAGGDLDAVLSVDQRRRITDWLLAQQFRSEHPFTGAAPGGWAWTDLPGGVPDADDTAGALIALHHLAPDDPRVHDAARLGLRWLADLRNRDGGMPTFCRGWGKLPFDRSSCDITAHGAAAAAAWRRRLGDILPIDAGWAYLRAQQTAAGAWLPLWFGNQHRDGEDNPTYGTARVVLAMTSDPDRLAHDPALRAMYERALTWLAAGQAGDGGWGGGPGAPSTIEETALALDALASARCVGVLPSDGAAQELPPWDVRKHINSGIGFLAHATADGKRFDASPIGFYFAKLWYFERLYPVIFTLAAVGRARQLLNGAGETRAGDSVMAKGLRAL